MTLVDQHNPSRICSFFGLIRIAAFLGVLSFVSAQAALTLSWDVNSTDEDGFKIERADGAGPFVQITQIAVPGTSTYIDNAVTPGNQYTYRVRAYNVAGDSAYSNVITNAPTITTQPVGASINVRSPVTFTAAATGVPTPTFQWQKGGVPISGATGATYTIASAVLADAATYTVVATNGISPAATSSGATLVVTPIPLTPSVTANNKTYDSTTTASIATATLTGVLPGDVGNVQLTVGSASFALPGVGNGKTVTASGLGLTGSAAGDYALTTSTATTTANITVLTVTPVVTVNNKGYDGTNAATILNRSITGAVSGDLINLQLIGGTATFADALVANGKTVTVTGLSLTGAVSGNYQLSSSTATTTANITLATVTPSITASNKVYDGTTTATISGRSLTGVAAGDVGNVTLTGGTATFATAGVGNGKTVTATGLSLTGSAIGNYQLSSSSATTTANITAAPATVALSNLTQSFDGSAKPVTVTTTPTGITTTVTYAGSATVPSAVGTYAVVATISDPNYTGTASGTLTIVGPPVVTSATTAGGIVGVPFSYTITASNTPTGFNATGLPTGLSVNTTTGVISGTPTAAGPSTITLSATNTAGTGNATLTLTVVTPTAPGITTQPTNQSANSGGSATFTVVATGNPAPTYQWKKNTIAITGATNASLTLSSVTSSDAASYTVDVTNIAGTVTSNAATLTVTTPPPNSGPVISVQPVSQSVSLGTSISFNVIATGNPAPTYQWRFNGSPISGATSSQLSLANIKVTDAGSYDVLVSNSSGTTTSVAATLTVTSAPVITTQPSNQNLVAGNSTSISLAVTAAGSGPLTYQWRKSSAAIAGATSASYTKSPVTLQDGGSYDVIVTNPFGSVTSSAATITVAPVSYAGQYFGTLTGGGTWALYVRADNTGTFIAYLPDRNTAIVQSVTVNADGSFTVVGSEISNAPDAVFLAEAGAPRIAATASSFTLTAQITGTSVSGQLAGINKTITGSADASSGPAQSLAGFYSATALGTTSGTTYSIVGASGQVFVVTTTSSFIDGSTGTIGTGGKVTTTTASGAQLAATITPQALSVSYTPTGSGTSLAFSGVADTVPVTTRLVNISARAVAASGNDSLIAGFVVAGGSKTILVRGVGPTLTQYGVKSGQLDDPTLGLYSGQTAVLTNDDWNSAANADQVASAITTLGAFPLSTGSRDAALLSSVSAGNYSAQVSGKSAATGIALAEIYDAAKTATPRLINLSARGPVGTGDNVLIAGFVLEGNAPKQILIRAIGPTLATFNVTGVVADPQLAVYVQGSSTPLQQNNDWGGTAALKAAFLATGAFGFPDNSKDAALLITLAPGNYSAVVSGVNNTTGIGMVELYEMP
jgi:hypothetical protein